jgi:hypothetical protein
MSWVPSPARQASRLCALAVTTLLFLLINIASASPESPTPTPKPKPTLAETKTSTPKERAAKRTSKASAAYPRLTPTGEPVHASHPVDRGLATPRNRSGVTVWRGWLVGLDGNYVRGQYARLPDGRVVDASFEIQQQYNAQHGIQRPRMSKAELEAYRRRLEAEWDKEVARREKGDEKITPEQIYLWRRMDRPPGAPFRNFIEDRARYGEPVFRAMMPGLISR